MKLEHYFRLITMSIFQDRKNNYNTHYFYCPKIYCNDGFHVSLQINCGNYCTSENGYRELGVDWQEIEFGFPSMNEKDMWKYSEMWGQPNWDEEGEEIPFNESNFDVRGTVGRISIIDMQKVIEKHGGIDFDTTLSKEKALKFIKVNK